MTTKKSQILRVGILGLGEIAQVSHIHVLNNLSDYFQTTYLCDVSPQAIEHVKNKVTVGIPKTTTNPEELIASPDVDVVLVCNVNAYHSAHAIQALQHNKYVFVEKPVAMNYRDIDQIIDAEKASKGKVFVGYQRRYAQAFVDALKEFGDMDKVEYIRVRDIIGPNSAFVSQSGTFPKKFTDFPPDAAAQMRATEEEMVKTALVHEYGVEATPTYMTLFRLFTGLGVHDFSGLRELVGMPTKVLGSSLGLPIWNVLFQYDGFPVMYESGIIDVPVFDAHLEIYSRSKIVRINYDTPYVKGLPVTMTIREKMDGEGYQERNVRKTYEDPFTSEFLAFHQCVMEKSVPKTSALDARADLDLIKMIMQSGAN